MLTGLAAYVTVRGIVPALSRVDTDFPNYLTAAKIVADGGEVNKLYDDSWFQGQMRRYQVGNPARGKFAPFPPPTALLLVPLSSLAPLDALRVMTGLNIVCLLAAIALLARVLCRDLLEAAVFVFLSGYAIISGLRFGQPYILISAACIAGYYARLQRRPVLAGICFGVFAPIKYFPIVPVLFFAFRKEWRLVLGSALAVLLVVIVSIAVLGWQIHLIFLTSILGDHLVGNLSMQDPFAASFQSFDSLFRRLFVFDATANPRPWLALPALRIICLIATKIALVSVALTVLVRLARHNAATATAPSLGILGILTFLIAPATASYHLVLLWLPLGLLLDYLVREGQRASALLILGSYALIGFFPGQFAAPFAGQGGLLILVAYYRLLLLLGMFIVAVGAAGRVTRQTRAPSVVGTSLLNRS